MTLFGSEKGSAPARIAVGLPLFSSASTRGAHLVLRLSTKRAAIQGAFVRRRVSPAQSASVSPLRHALYIVLNSFSAFLGSSRASRRINAISRSDNPPLTAT